jgi:DeoR family ulaG and ulaABCDEF operon transcriptional repressor
MDVSRLRIGAKTPAMRRSWWNAHGRISAISVAIGTLGGGYARERRLFMLEMQRQILILDIVDEAKFASLKTLIEETGASEATIRRDLIKLAGKGQIKQLRGGAMSVRTEERLVSRRRLAGSAFLASIEREMAAKQAIAKAAVGLCADGDAIIINGGSTTCQMAEFLIDRELSILTNSLALGVELIERSNNRIVFPAGEANRKLSFILNPFDDPTTDAFRASRYFLSACAVSRKGIMEADPLVARAEQRFAEQADEIILMVDSTKIGRNSSYAAFELSRIDMVITDERIDKASEEMFADHGVEVLVAPAIHSNAKRRA